MKNSEVVFIQPHQVKISETAYPVIGSDDVLIKMEYVGVCGSDTHTFLDGPYIPPSDPNIKVRMGHEAAGEVVAVGERVIRFKAGDKVVIEPGVPCMKCRFCLEGKYNLCLNMDFLGTSPNYRGAMTEFMAYPERMTYHLPASLTALEGALIEPAAVGLHSAMLGQAAPGKKVVILGAGCIGLFVLQSCLLLGASEIIIVDIIGNRLELASKLGARVTLNATACDVKTSVMELTEGLGADIVFEATGLSSSASLAVQLISRGGRILIVGTIPVETPINFLKINREVTIQTVFRYVNTFPLVIESAVAGKIDLKSVVSQIYPYEQIQEALEDITTHKDQIIKGLIKIT